MEARESKKRTLKEIKEDLIQFFKNKQEVLLVYLFGSCVRGKLEKHHDIDIAILVDSKIYHVLDAEKPYGYEAEIIAELIRHLKYPLVDLTLLNKAAPLLAYEVIHGGTVLFSQSEDLRVEFEISSLKRHADTKHLREIKRIYSEGRTEKGLLSYA
jgi:predicted nucleotidyltransferase